MAPKEDAPMLPITSLKKDLLSGFLVSLLALPLSMGIAMASGFPPIAGIFTACIGGCLASWWGSARLTIKGPAAGLIVIVLSAVQELGAGDPQAGYRRTLAVGVGAALIQMAFALARLGVFAEIMPPAVVHGLLAAIGVIIMSKQIHLLCGVTPAGHEPLELLREIPHSLQHANPEVLLIGGLSFLMLFALPYLKKPIFKKVPPPLVALCVSIPLAAYFGFSTPHSYTFWGSAHSVGPTFLVNLPANFLEAITFPDFSLFFSFHSLKYVFLLSVIGMIESLLTVSAMDTLDPKRIPSSVNRDLFAVGASNLVASLIGGLPLISEIVRSKANLDNGGTSQWANFTHGVCLLLAIAFFPDLLHHIPMAVLAAMLVYTGSRLASPNEFVHSYHTGRDQFFLFLLTMITTLCTDLLIGVAVGLLAKFFLHTVRGAPIRKPFVVKSESEPCGDTQVLKMEGACTFTNYLSLKKQILSAQAKGTIVELDFKNCKLIDYTTQSKLQELQATFGTDHFKITGFEHHRAASEDPAATKIWVR